MRKKLAKADKRDNFLGVKVQSKTKKQLEYISDRDKTPMSTLINQIIIDHIEKYFKIAKIDWDSLPEEEKRGGKPK